jgi:LCP family protein required for cell wall assembly
MIDFKKRMQELDRLEGRVSSDTLEDDLFIVSQKKKKTRIYIISVLVIALVFSGKIIMSSQSATSWLPGINFFNRLLSFVPIAEKHLEGEDGDRVNILLLGVGGESHEAGNLTDTIMIASLKPSTKQVALISLPRDLVSPLNGWRKINSINVYAEKEDPGSGGEVTSESIGELLQMPIHYYIRVDFNGFEKIIDELGGVEINVENSFTDYMYPIRGEEENTDYYARYEKLAFTAGPTKMDGALALKYARSRHALGIEGSDFARAKRQQLLLEAIKSKLLSHHTLLNPVTIGKLINELNKNLSTNLSAWELLRLWDLSKDVDRAQIINRVLNDAPDNYLVAGKGQDGAYILTPKTGNFSEIRNMLRDLFNNELSSSSVIEENLTESASVFITNGTWVTGLASKTGETLKQSSFSIIGTANALDRNYEQSVVYDLTAGEKNEALIALKKATGATQAFNSPTWIEEYKTGDNKSDFLLILGTDANK